MAYEIGDLIFTGYGGDRQLLCDGSLHPEAEYPELAAMLKAIAANGYDYGPEGFFYVPSIGANPYDPDLPVYIQAE